MAPPKTVRLEGKEKIKLDAISFGEDSGWRDLDLYFSAFSGFPLISKPSGGSVFFNRVWGGRFSFSFLDYFSQDEEMVIQLMETYEAGNFGQTALSQITFLPKEDMDGKQLIDNGLSSCTALYRLFQKWLTSGEARLTLIDVFKEGLDGVFKQYEDDDKSVRRLWNASIHSPENLLIRRTTVLTQIRCAKDYLDKYETDAVKKMTEVLGCGQNSMCKRWVRNARALAGSKEVMDALAACHSILPHGFINDNLYFLGPREKSEGPNVELSAKYKAIALQLVHQVWQNRVCKEDALSIVKSDFVEKWCKCLRALQAWEKTSTTRFGDVASKSLWFSRVVESLATVSGIDKMNRCLASNTPFHGKGAENVGIEECHQLYKELSRCKAGGLPPPAVPASGDIKDGLPPDQKDGLPPAETEVDEASKLVELQASAREQGVLASLVGAEACPEGLTEEQSRLYNKAKAYFDPCNITTSEAAFTETAKQWSSTGRAILVNDCRTTVKGTIAEAATLLSQIATVPGAHAHRMFTFIGNRSSIEHRSDAISSFPNLKVWT